MLMYHFTFETTNVLFWKRLVAQVIDILIVLTGVFLVVAWTSVRGVVFQWIVVWVYLVYSMLMDAYAEGTVGKLTIGLKVVMNKKKEPKLLTAFYRNFMKIILNGIGLDILLLPLRKGYSGWHNRVAKTRIVNENIIEVEP